LLATVIVTGAVCQQTTARAQELDPRTGLPNQTGVSYVGNGQLAPFVPQGSYGATLQPGGTAVETGGGAYGIGAQYTKFMPRVSATHLAGSGLGYHSGFTAVEGWIPLQVGEEHQLMFADLKGIVSNYSRIGANLGMGYRQYNRDRNTVLGVYGYYDYRDSGNARYNQVSAGFEVLSSCWDVRGNVYVPVNDEVTTLADIYDCDNPLANGNFIYLTHSVTRESAMRGFDLEIGRMLIPRYRTKIYGGTYFFDGRDLPQAYGARARLETYATQGLQLQLTIQHDRVFGTNVWGGFTVSFPGANQAMNPDGSEDIFYRLNDPVQRLYNVVVSDYTEVTQEAATSLTTGQPIRFFYVDDNAAAGGNGSFEAPFNTLAQAEAGTLAGDVIFVRAGTYVNDSITLKADQQLLGDGIPVPVANDPKRLGGHRIVSTQCPDGFLLPNVSTNIADRPTIINSPGSAITLANRNQVASFNITGAGAFGIVGNNVQSPDIHDVTVNQSALDGVRITGAFGNLSLRNVTATHNGINGVSIFNQTPSTLTAELLCVFANQNGNHGIELLAQGGATQNVLIDQSTANNNTNFGLQAVADAGTINLTVTNSQFNNNGAGGTFVSAINGGTINANLRGSQFNNNGGAVNPSAGVLFFAGNATSSGDVVLNIANSQLTGNADSGLQGRMENAGSSTDLTVTNSLLANNTFAGFTMNAQDGVMQGRFVNNQFINNQRQGIAYRGFGNSNATLDFINNTITGNGAGVGAPLPDRDGVLLQVFTTNANALTANFTGNVISANGAGGRGNGIFINGFNIGAAAAGITVNSTGDVISNNVQHGIFGLFGGGATGAPLNVNIAVDSSTIFANASDGIQANFNQFAVATVTVDNSTISFNGANGVNLLNQALATGEAPSLDTRIQNNTISDNGTATFLAAGIAITQQGSDGNQNNININNNVEIARNNVGILIFSSTRTATSITNHRNALNDNPRIFNNPSGGIVILHAFTGGPVPQDRTTVHDVRITNNSISSPSEAIVLGVQGGSANPALGGGRMDALVTQNLLSGPGFGAVISPLLLPAPPFRALPAAGITTGNARFFAISAGVRSYMRLRLEQNNQNDLQYNLVNAGPFVSQAGNTDGSLFDVASTAGTNSGLTNPGLAPEFFGPNTGVYGFAVLNFPFGPEGADFDPANTNFFINVVQPNNITPGPFPPPP
jgi:hypothetical protein